MPSNVQSTTVMVPPVRLNATNGDTVPGGYLSTKTGSAIAPAQLGQKVYLGGDEIKYDPAIGTLYAGGYQYVQFDTQARSAAAYARGQIVFWESGAIPTFLVTNLNLFGTRDGNQAGIVLNTVTYGNYWWIQIAGLASVLFSNTQSHATPAVKDLVVHVTAGYTADAIPDATPITASLHKRAIGVAAEAPVAGAISLVELYDQFRNV
jgi:hypothetical protein